MTTLVLDPPADLINANLVAAFTIKGEPASKARARFTGYGSKVRAYTPAKTLTAEARVRDAYLLLAHPGTDKDVAFGVKVEFLHETGQRRDVDNMLKLILDGLNKIAWPDDVQVTSIQATKRRVPKGEAETRIRIYELGRIDKPRGKCIRCGTEFAQYASTSSRKYCTRKCGYAHSAEKRARTCLNCATEFQPHSAETEQPYCTRECASAHKRVTKTCANCGDDYTIARSLSRAGIPNCSQECRDAYWRNHRKVRSAGTCQDCGGPTSRKDALRCKGCHLAAGNRWAANKRIKKVPK